MLEGLERMQQENRLCLQQQHCQSLIVRTLAVAT